MRQIIDIGMNMKSRAFLVLAIWVATNCLAQSKDSTNPLTHEQVTNQILELYTKHYNKKYKTNHPLTLFKNKFLGLTAENPGEKNIKNTFENRIEGQLNKEIIFNSETVNPIELIEQGEMQCYSGTTCYMLMDRISKSGENYERNNPVAIMTPGHVLPGYMELIKGKWHLKGIEMTAAGKAEIDYGPVSNLGKRKEPIAFIGATDFLKLQITQEKTKANETRKVALKAFMEAIKKYGNHTELYFKYLKHKRTVWLKQEKSKDNKKVKSDLNNQVFGFKSAKPLPKGKFKRKLLGQVKDDGCGSIGIIPGGKNEDYRPFEGKYKHKMCGYIHSSDNLLLFTSVDKKFSSYIVNQGFYTWPIRPGQLTPVCIYGNDFTKFRRDEEEFVLVQEIDFGVIHTKRGLQKVGRYMKNAEFKYTFNVDLFLKNDEKFKGYYNLVAKDQNGNVYYVNFDELRFDNHNIDDILRRKFDFREKSDFKKAHRVKVYSNAPIHVNFRKQGIQRILISGKLEWLD